MERSRMIEWVDNDDNDNDEDANLICLWWHICEVFIEQEHIIYDNPRNLAQQAFDLEFWSQPLMLIFNHHPCSRT